MKPKSSSEVEIRTPEKNLLVCTVASTPDGSVEIISRHGKQEDRIKMDAFLKEAYAQRKTS